MATDFGKLGRIKIKVDGASILDREQERRDRKDINKKGFTMKEGTKPGNDFRKT